jgi:phosphate starvation-inducible PhoH-like protein
MKEPARERKNPIKAISKIQLNEEQKIAAGYIYNNPITIITGRPGSGKSACAAHCALDFLNKKMTEKVVLFRPTVEVGRTLGFMPGDLRSKLSSYFEAFIENLEDCSVDKNKIKTYLEAGILTEQALQFVRGRTFSDFVVIDEAQNSTQKEMEALITRLGKTGKIVILGDLQQKDITSENDGLSWAIKLSERFDEIKRIDLKGNHRHDLVQKILDFTYKTK